MFAAHENDMEGSKSEVKARTRTKPNMPHLCAVLYSESTFVVNDDSPQLISIFKRKQFLKKLRMTHLS
jgi:hypothetical protein